MLSRPVQGFAASLRNCCIVMNDAAKGLGNERLLTSRNGGGSEPWYKFDVLATDPALP